MQLSPACLTLLGSQNHRSKECPRDTYWAFNQAFVEPENTCYKANTTESIVGRQWQDKSRKGKTNQEAPRSRRTTRDRGCQIKASNSIEPNKSRQIRNSQEKSTKRYDNKREHASKKTQANFMRKQAESSKLHAGNRAKNIQLNHTAH